MSMRGASAPWVTGVFGALRSLTRTTRRACFNAQRLLMAAILMGCGRTGCSGEQRITYVEDMALTTASLAAHRPA